MSARRQLRRLSQLHGIDASYTDIGGRRHRVPVATERALLEAVTSLKLSRLSKLLETSSGRREEMDALLQKLEKLLEYFSRVLSDKHFDHRSDTLQLVTTFWGEQ